MPTRAAPGGAYILSADHIISQARLRHIVAALSCVHYGDPTSKYEGDSSRGTLTHFTGTGKEVGLAWAGTGVAAVVYDKNYTHPLEPEDAFADAPRALSELIGRARALLIDLTGGFWLLDDVASRKPPFPARDGLHLLNGYVVAPEDALFSDLVHPNWVTQSSITDEQGRLAIRLAADTRPTVLRPEDIAIALEPYMDPPTAFNIENAKAMFAQVGIVWPS